MTAGIGQRLRPLTYVRAKPAVPVAGVPLISRILRRLRDQGIADVVLNLSHKPETLAALSAKAANSACASATRGSIRCSVPPAVPAARCRSSATIPS